MGTISELVARKRQKQRELDTYKKRKKKLESIKKDFDRDFDDVIADSVNFNERIGLELASGLQGEELRVKTLLIEIDSLKEKNQFNDSNMYDISENLDKEIRRCDSEIERLKAEIRRIERQIDAAEAAAVQEA